MSWWDLAIVIQRKSVTEGSKSTGHFVFFWTLFNMYLHQYPIQCCQSIEPLTPLSVVHHLGCVPVSAGGAQRRPSRSPPRLKAVVTVRVLSSPGGPMSTSLEPSTTGRVRDCLVVRPGWRRDGCAAVSVGVADWTAPARRTGSGRLVSGEQMGRAIMFISDNCG